jgi:hypothetical protein
MGGDGGENSPPNWATAGGGAKTASMSANAGKSRREPPPIDPDLIMICRF